MNAGMKLSPFGSFLKFVAAKAAISALFAAAFAVGYLAGESLLPELPGIWHVVSRVAIASAFASILPAGLAMATPGADMKNPVLLREIDDILVLTTIRVLPILLVFTASILAVLLLMTIGPQTRVLGTPVICCLCWLVWDRDVDQFLCRRFDR